MLGTQILNLSHCTYSAMEGDICSCVHALVGWFCVDSSWSLILNSSGCPCYPVNKINNRLSIGSMALQKTAPFWQNKVYLFEVQPVL